MSKQEKKEEKTLKEAFIDLIENIIDVSGNKGYKKFLFFLIMIDLAWFSSVVFDNIFGMNLQAYGEFAWIFLFSIGLIIISDVKKVMRIGQKGIRADNFSSMVTFTIGLMAFVVSILSLPQIHVTSPVMSSIKGIIALIAIIYVFIEVLTIKTE